MWHRAGKKAKYWHNFCSCWGLCGLDTCISKAGLFYVSDQSLDSNLTFLFLAFQDSLSATSRPHANSIMGEDYYPRNSILFETGNILVESRKCCYSLKEKSCSRRTVLEDPGPATSSEQSLRLMTVWVSRSSPADSLEVFFTIRRTIRATHNTCTALSLSHLIIMVSPQSATNTAPHCFPTVIIYHSLSNLNA